MIYPAGYNPNNPNAYNPDNFHTPNNRKSNYKNNNNSGKIKKISAISIVIFFAYSIIERILLAIQYPDMPASLPPSKFPKSGWFIFEYKNYLFLEKKIIDNNLSILTK